jgi:hypothetical protein
MLLIKGQTGTFPKVSEGSGYSSTHAKAFSESRTVRELDERKSAEKRASCRGERSDRIVTECGKNDVPLASKTRSNCFDVAQLGRFVDSEGHKRPI